MTTTTANLEELRKKQFQIASKEILDNYIIDESNESEIEALIMYFYGDEQFEEFNSVFSLDKSILLMGNVGTGKTMLMRIFQRLLMLKSETTFACRHIREIANMYIEDGAGVLNTWDGKDLFIDELGLTEKENVKRWGNNANIVSEIIMHRYDKFVYDGVKTHFCTNLTEQQLASEYDPRVWSRIKEMCNIIPLTGTDRRNIAKPNKKKIEQLPVQISQSEMNKKFLENIIKHQEDCIENKKYVPIGVDNGLAFIYYDFLIKCGVEFSNEDKTRLYNEAMKVLKMAKFDLKSTKSSVPLHEQCVIEAKKRLYKQYILNPQNNILQLLNKL